MLRQRPIELLAPAKNLECGMEAINHGADAGVYRCHLVLARVQLPEIPWKTLKPGALRTFVSGAYLRDCQYNFER